VRSREADVFDAAFLRALSEIDREPENPLLREVITVPGIFLMRLRQAGSCGGNERSALRRNAPLSLLPISNTTPFGDPIPTAHRVSPLRQRMIEDMTVRNFAPGTQDIHVGEVSLFAGNFVKSPEQLGPEEIRAYQIYLAEEKRASVSTRIVAVSALRFLCHAPTRLGHPVHSGSQEGLPFAGHPQPAGGFPGTASGSFLGGMTLSYWADV